MWQSIREHFRDVDTCPEPTAEEKDKIARIALASEERVREVLREDDDEV